MYCWNDVLWQGHDFKPPSQNHLCDQFYKRGTRNLLHYSHLWQITVVRAPGFGSSLEEERFSSSCWQCSRWCISRCTLAASEARLAALATRSVWSTSKALLSIPARSSSSSRNSAMTIPSKRSFCT